MGMFLIEDSLIGPWVTNAIPPINDASLIQLSTEMEGVTGILCIRRYYTFSNWVRIDRVAGRDARFELLFVKTIFGAPTKTPLTSLKLFIEISIEMNDYELLLFILP